MVNQQNATSFAQRFNETIWQDRNLEAIDDLVSEELVMHDPGLQGPIHGPEGVRAVVGMVLTAFPDLEIETETVVAERDTLAVHNRCFGTHEGEYLGMAPTGRGVEIHAAAFQRIVDGKLVEEWQLVDRVDLLGQLGVIELPVAGWEDERATGSQDQVQEPTDSLAEDKRIARRFPEEVATGGHIDRIDDICATGVVEHTPLGVLRGREELKEQSEYIHSAFPDVSVTIEDEVAAGDTVAHRLTFRGTHKGEFAGIEPTGQTVEIANMLFTRIENGQIAERWLLADMFGLLQQVGAVELSGELPAGPGQVDQPQS